MIELLRSLVADGRTDDVIHECRACGTVVEADATRCSSCGSDDIARYEIE